MKAKNLLSDFHLYIQIISSAILTTSAEITETKTDTNFGNYKTNVASLFFM